MSLLKSQLLNVLPASERDAFAKNINEPAAPRAVSVERVNGVEALKEAISYRNVQSYKYAKADDRLYVYFDSEAALKKMIVVLEAHPEKIGNLEYKKSGPYSLRINKASTYSAVVGIASAPIANFDDYVRQAKSHFTASHGAKDVSIVFRVDNVAKTITATATSNRIRTSDFELSRRVLSTRLKGITTNTAAGYQATAVFDFATYVVETTPKKPEVLKQEPQEVNALLEGLKSSMAPAEELTFFSGRFPQAVVEQFARIIAGERLPAEPQMAIYDDLAAIGKTKGTAVALFYKNGKRVDVEAILADLRLKNKSAAVFPTEVSKAILHDVTVVDPAVIIMRDHGDASKAFLVLNTTKGFHRHVALQKRK
ncbi:hypothetical protein D3C75_447090 [compost metagenome]